MNIKADRELLTPFLDKLKDGKILIPKFQRAFVWTPRQIIDLFDSVMQGFPIGSIILWVPASESFGVLDDVEGVKLNTDGQYYDSCYVLDGRQRITTLLSVLCEGGDYTNRVYVSLEDMKPFILNKQPATRNYANIRLYEAFDPYLLVGFLEGLKASKLSDIKKTEYAEKAKMLTKILTSYEIGYIKVVGGRIDDAVEIFSRLNSKATPISTDYMIQALAYNESSDFLFGESITHIRRGLQCYNFDKIKRELIYKCVFNHTSVPFIDGKMQRVMDLGDTLPNVMQDVNEEVKKAVKFLYKTCGVIDYTILPYSYQLVMIANYFHNNPFPTDEQLLGLKKWFFYTSYSCYFTNTSLSVIRENLKTFETYAKNLCDAPIMYNYDDIDMTLPDCIRLSGVRSCVFVAWSVLQNGANNNSDSILQIFVLPDVEGRPVGAVFVCNSKEEVSLVQQILSGNIEWESSYSRFGLTEKLCELYQKQSIDRFVADREAYLKEKEQDFVKDMFLPLYSEQNN